MKRFKKILCVVEPSESSEAAVIQAVRVAADHQASLTFVSISTDVGLWGRLFNREADVRREPEDYSDEKRQTLNSWLKEFKINKNYEVDVYEGIGFIEIIRRVIQQEFDLVVKCSDDVDWLNRLFGSEDMNLLRKCPCPVLMLKSSQKNVFQNVMATVDVNEELAALGENRVQEDLNSLVLEYAATFSMSELTELHVCSVWDALGESYLRHSAFSDVSEEKVVSYVENIRQECLVKVNDLVNDLNESIGDEAADYLQPRVHLVKGNPGKEIALMAKTYNADLIVMGTVARTGIPGLIIGNSAESILEQVQCSVLAIKPEGFKTPVV